MEQELPAKLLRHLRNLVPEQLDPQAQEQVQVRLQNALLVAGYPAAIIAVTSGDTRIQFSVNPGPKYYFGQLALLGVPVDGPLNRYLPGEGAALSDAEIARALTEWLNFYENNGYPFVSITLESSAMRNDSLDAIFHLDRGPLRLFDSVVVKGAYLPKSLISKQLGIRTGKRYSESTLRKSENLLQTLPYLEMARSPQVLFTETKTTVYLYVTPQQRFQFDGLVGLNTMEDGTLTLNGDLNLRLINSLKRGEDFRLNWRSPDAGVQQFFTALEVPYWFQTPIWTDVRFKLFRQDSTWANRDFAADVGYQIMSGTSITAGYTWMQSSVLQVSGPQNGNVRSRFFLTGVDLRQLDDLVVPSKGIRLVAQIGQGSRQTENGTFAARNFMGAGEWHKRIKGRHGLVAEVEAAGIWTSELVFNELYRIGGFRTLRGFNELSLFAARYGLISTEYRYFLERYSFLFAFVDGGFLQNPIGEIPDLWAMGIGAGLSFRTGGGMFTFALALGRTDAQPWDARLAKVHVGFVNGF